MLIQHKQDGHKGIYYIEEDGNVLAEIIYSSANNDQLMIIFLCVAFIEYFDVIKKNRLNAIQNTQRRRLATSPCIYLLIRAHITTNTILGMPISRRSFRRISL